MDSGATIDLSGSVATVPVTRNLVSVELRANEFADDPLQRNGPLRGKTVVVDARADNGAGTNLASVSGAIGLIPRGILERTSQGGSAVFDSKGDISIASGATVNVSGGAVNYTGGIMQTTQLVTASGKLVDISQANPNQLYTGILNPVFKSSSNQWGVISFIPTPGISHYEAGYTQGADAGSVQFMAPTMVLNGTFQGNVVNGPRQRSVSTMAQGGQFIIGDPTGGLSNSGLGSGTPDFRAPEVQLTQTAPNIVFDNDTALPSNLVLDLPVSFMTAGGFSRVQISSNERISLAADTPLTVLPGGSLSLLAPRIDIDSSISAPGGNISAQSLVTVISPNQPAGIFVGSNVRLDVSGLWTNDSLFPLGTLPTGIEQPDAGSIQLSQQVLGGTLSVGSGTSLLADGGAWLQQSGALASGKGGKIGLISAIKGYYQQDSSKNGGGIVQFADNIRVGAFGVQGAVGGSFTLEAPRIDISSGDTSWMRAQSVTVDPASNSSLKIDSSLFADFGFSTFTLTADGPRTADAANPFVLNVDPGSNINLQTRTLLLGANARARPSGSGVAGFAQSTLLPNYQRQPSQLKLNAVPVPATFSDVAAEAGGLRVGINARITADPQSTLALNSFGTLEFDGAATLPAGNVSLAILSPHNVLIDPTGTGQDPGFVPDLRIELGSSARIDVSGTAVYQPNDAGILKGTVLPGGTVSLTAERGFVLTDAGSYVDFAGTQAPLDLPDSRSMNASNRSTVASAGGSFSVASLGSISLLGDFNGAAGVGSTGRAAGGSLNVELSEQILDGAAKGLPTAPWIIQLNPNAAQVSPSDSNRAVLDANTIAHSGVDSLTLIADSAIELSGGTNLALARSIVLQSPAIAVDAGAPVSVSAPYIALGAGLKSSKVPPLSSPQPGLATVQFSADQIDLIGSLSFQGVSAATLASTGDIQLRGDEDAGASTNTGSLSIMGDLTLSAARVVPSTTADYVINANFGSGNTVQFQQTGTSPGTPLSVGGSLTVHAANIVQAGTLIAPFGTIDLDASNSLTLAAGSLTSVSGSGSLLPYGLVENGTAWVYPTNTLNPTPVTGIPNRQVTLNGATVTLAKGSTVDVSGGGDLYGYQWTPGTGGTQDWLANGAIPNLYAIIPSLGSHYAPYDPVMYQGSNLTTTPGQSIYLSGMPGLPAGTYVLLPPRYALLPGAYLVQATSGFSDLQPGTAASFSDGSTVVAGRFTFANTGLGDTRYNGFIVRPAGPGANSYAHQLDDFTDVTASAFFSGQFASAGSSSAPPTLPADAGTLALSVDKSLDALGTVLTKAAQGGKKATIELAATQIEVDPSLAAASAKPGVVHISTDVLGSWSPGTVLLGGQRTLTGVQVGTDSVHVTAGSALVADEVILVGRQSIFIDSGASVESTSAANKTAPSAAPLATPGSFDLTGDGASGAAVLAVSDLHYLLPTRPTDTPTSTGTVTIGSGAQVASLGTLTVDSPGGAQIADGALSGAGARWSLGAGHVTFGVGPAAPGTLAIDTSLAGALETAASIRIASETSIDLLQGVSLGSSSGSASPIHDITLVGTALNNFVDSSASSFAATKISLGGNNTSTPSAPASGTGTLTFSADEIDVGPGTLALSGFTQTSMQAINAVVGTGTGGLVASGNVDIRTGLITTATGATTTVSAPEGTLLLGSAVAGSKASTSAPVPGFGGSFTASGQSLIDATSILLPSGEVALNGTQQLSIQYGAAINVAGELPSFAAGSHGSPGGSITLQSGGDLGVASGVLVTVAGASGADAGRIDITAAGSASLAGDFEASTNSGQLAGTFTVKAGSLTDFVSLNQQLEKGGFSQERDFRVTTGDLDFISSALIPSPTITAHHVELTADNGSVVVAGKIDATDSGERGYIGLNARNDLTVTGSGELLANAGDPASRGGLIELFSSAGQVNLLDGATLSATGVNTGALTIRAPMSASGDNIKANISANLTHIDSVNVEPIVAVALPDSTLAQADLNTIMSEQVTPYTTVAFANILNKMPNLAASNVHLRPYVDLTYQGGDLTIDTLNLSSYRFGGQAADIAFRASGNLNVSGTISDGFVIRTNTTNPKFPYLDLTCQTSVCSSSGITLVAGADFSAAAPASVRAGAGADLDLQGGAIVRTATGDIHLAAAHDINIGDDAGKASIYTAGAALAKTAILNKASKIVSAYASGDSLISLVAGNDVKANEIAQAVGDWQPRSSVSGMASWGLNLGNFGWSVGALGGGDVVIRAGRNVTNVSAAVADSAVVNPIDGALQTSGGGNLVVQAGGDVGSAYLYVADGWGRVQAGGAINSARQTSDAGKVALGSMLMAGNASFTLNARGDVLLEGEFQPTLFNINQQDFFRYGPESALRIASTGGSVTENGGVGSSQPTFFGDGPNNSSDISNNILPASLDIASYGGDVNITGFSTLFPSVQGQLNIVAARDIVTPGSGGMLLRMSDVAPSLLPTAAAPISVPSLDALVQTTAFSALHAADPATAVISAGRDIDNLSLSVAKPIAISAGRDINNPGFVGQNLNPTDTTSIIAGRNIVYTTDATSPVFDANLEIKVGGPGQLEMLAGGNIDFGFSKGVTTEGNLLNPNLTSSTGADVIMFAGQGAPLGVATSSAPGQHDFVSDIIGASTAYQQQLETYVDQLKDKTDLDFSDAAAAFRGLSEAQQLPLLTNVLFQELVTSGREANSDPKLGFTRGRAAIDSLFPGARGSTSPYAGSLTLDTSRIYTLQGGSISLLVPGGGVNVGLAFLPPELKQLNITRNASDLGIVAVGPGDVQIFSRDDVDVNSSRVFTLGGGNIVVWSDQGNIDAGRGAKSSLSAPPPTITATQSGQIVVDFTNTVSGSGIRTIQSGPGVTPGNVDLIAPEGFVNAGDAGIGSSGNLNVAAQRVLGLDNIQVNGTSTGVPPEVSGIGASLSGAAAAGSSTTTSSNTAITDSASAASRAAPIAEAALGWLDVFVEGFGEEVCKASDTACLDREKQKGH
jgi:hypothetical protein